VIVGILIAATTVPKYMDKETNCNRS
jgi:hypothetical protein